MQPRAFCIPLGLSSAQPIESAFEPDCFDFAAYLARRLGVGSDLAMEVLGHWLGHYEAASDQAGSAAPALG